MSLRLHGLKLGPMPITVHEVDKAREFSVFQWLALDELQVSHDHDQMVSLENAYRVSNRGFDASSAEADDPSRWKELQKACLASALTEEERTEYLVDYQDDDNAAALLLYLPQHNIGEILVAHRALLLAGTWGKMPQDLGILLDAVVALKSIDTDAYKRLSYAVRLEIWQTHVRPMYRALLFGFDDVQEVSAEIVAPLFEDVNWVADFSEITSTVLDMLNEFTWLEAESIDLQDEYIERVQEASWPVPTECPLLAKLIRKNRKLRSSAFTAHKMLMISLKITQDLEQLSQCIPSFYDIFTPGSLFQKTVPMPDGEEYQQALMQDSVVNFARNYSGPSMDTLTLGDIGTLSELFDFDMNNIRTLFLLAMYEYGKDRIVDDIITRSSSLISVPHFCDGGVEIVCRRLNYILHLDPTEEIKNIMGTLDANMCEWIQEKAENSEALVGDEELVVPPGNTHLFALRLLSLGANADIPKSERIKIHSLIVLSGSIVKGLEGLHSHENTSIELPPMDISLPSMPDESAYKSDPEEHEELQDSAEEGTEEPSDNAEEKAPSNEDPWKIFASNSNDEADEARSKTPESPEVSERSEMDEDERPPGASARSEADEDEQAMASLTETQLRNMDESMDEVFKDSTSADASMDIASANDSNESTEVRVGMKASSEDTSSANDSNDSVEVRVGTKPSGSDASDEEQLANVLHESGESYGFEDSSDVEYDGDTSK